MMQWLRQWVLQNIVPGSSPHVYRPCHEEDTIGASPGCPLLLAAIRPQTQAHARLQRQQPQLLPQGGVSWDPGLPAAWKRGRWRPARRRARVQRNQQPIGCAARTLRASSRRQNASGPGSVRTGGRLLAHAQPHRRPLLTRSGRCRPGTRTGARPGCSCRSL